MKMTFIQDAGCDLLEREPFMKPLDMPYNQVGGRILEGILPYLSTIDSSGGRSSGGGSGLPFAMGSKASSIRGPLL